jgi:diadenosine tetraphosphate (Ap4A) HIT family hydrolase
MAATTLTGSIDGGVVFPESLSSQSIGDQTLLRRLEGASLFWAKGTATQSSDTTGLESQNRKSMVRLRKHHFPEDSRTDCWFCLASPTCEKHLIVDVKDSCYVTMPKGAMSPFHCLIVPIEHKSQGALVHDRKTIDEVEAFKDQLRRHAREELHQDLFIFERAIQTKGGYHTHMQCIPLEHEHTQTLYTTLMAMSREAGFELKEVNTDLSVKAMLKDEEAGTTGYFYAEIPFAGGTEQRRLVCITSSSSASEANENSGDGGTRQKARSAVPLQFGRAVAAKLMGKPELTEWKACVVSEDEEAELACKLRDSLAKYA